MSTVSVYLPVRLQIKLVRHLSSNLRAGGGLFISERQSHFQELTEQMLLITNRNDTIIATVYTTSTRTIAPINAKNAAT
jgi:chemotaxis methyl-accepting protein methylase